MLGSLLRRLTGQRSEPARPLPSLPLAAETEADAPPAADQQPGEPDLPMSSLEASALTGVPGKSPVFSSRAVRDATVVTGTIESLNRFVAGQDVLDDLIWRLESLTADQVNFLQLSAEPGLIQRAQARSEMLKGAKAAALRKLLTDLASGAIPEPASRGTPLVPYNAPILPPLTSFQPRLGDGPASPLTSLGPSNPVPPGPGAPSLTTAPPLAAKPIPPAPAKPVAAAPLPPKPATAVPATVEVKAKDLEPKLPEAKPADARAPDLKPSETKLSDVKPTSVKPAEGKPPELKPVEPRPVEQTATAKAPDPVVVAAAKAAPTPQPMPAEPPRPVPAPVPTKVQAEPPRPAPASPTPPEPALPRLGRQDAEARRARLLASLNDTLSSSEAAL